MYRILGKDENISALTFTPDGKRLIACQSEDGKENDQVVEWNLAKKSIIHKYDSGHYGMIVSANYSPSGRLLALGHFGGFVSVRDDRRRVVFSFQSVENLTAQLELALISEKNGLSVYSIVGLSGEAIAQQRFMKNSQVRICHISCGGSQINSAAGTPDGTTFVSGSTKSINVYREGKFASFDELKSFEVFKDPVITSIAISSNASLVLAYDAEGGDLALFDVKNDKLVRKWKGHEDRAVNVIAPFHRRAWFATGDATAEVKLWDEKGKLLAVLKHKESDFPLAALAFARDDGFLAAAGEGGAIFVWDLRAFLSDELLKK